MNLRISLTHGQSMMHPPWDESQLDVTTIYGRLCIKVDLNTISFTVQLENPWTNIPPDSGYQPIAKNVAMNGEWEQKESRCKTCICCPRPSWVQKKIPWAKATHASVWPQLSKEQVVKDHEETDREMETRSCKVSKQYQIITRSYPGFPSLFLRLPPTPTDVGNLQNLMLREADLVGIVWVGLIWVDCLGSIRILRRSPNLMPHWMIICHHRSSCYTLCRRVGRWAEGSRTTEPGLRGISVVDANGPTRVAWHRRGGFEATQLRRSVHLWDVVAWYGCLGPASAIIIRDGSAVPHWSPLLFV